jgi:hypothetical protein
MNFVNYLQSTTQLQPKVSPNIYLFCKSIQIIRKSDFLNSYNVIFFTQVLLNPFTEQYEF